MLNHFIYGKNETKHSKKSLKTKIETIKKGLSISESTRTDLVPLKTGDVEPKRSMRQRNSDKTSTKNKMETAKPSTATAPPAFSPSSTKRKRRSIKLYNQSDDENSNIIPLEDEKVCSVEQRDEVQSANSKEATLVEKKGPPKKKTKGTVSKVAETASKDQKSLVDDKFDNDKVSKTDFSVEVVVRQTDQTTVQKEQSEKARTKILNQEPKKPVVAVERKGNDEAMHNNGLKEFCVRCKTYIDIPDPSNALDSIVQHCENCPKVLTKDILPCYKCLFTSKCKEEFRTHITNKHLSEDASKKAPEGEFKQKLLQELLKQKRGALLDKRSYGNIGKTSAPTKPDAEKESSEKNCQKSKIATVPGQDVPTHSCIHCKKSIHIQDPCFPTSCLIYHIVNCSNIDKKTVNCYHCTLTFASLTDLRNHISNLHAHAGKQIPQFMPRKSASNNTSAKKDKSFKCRHCNEELASANALQMHMITHRVH